jgi:hypothetical protein
VHNAILLKKKVTFYKATLSLMNVNDATRNKRYHSHKKHSHFFSSRNKKKEKILCFFLCSQFTSQTIEFCMYLNIESKTGMERRTRQYKNGKKNIKVSLDSFHKILVRARFGSFSMLSHTSYYEGDELKWKL